MSTSNVHLRFRRNRVINEIQTPPGRKRDLYLEPMIGEEGTLVIMQEKGTWMCPVLPIVMHVNRQQSPWKRATIHQGLHCKEMIKICRFRMAA